MSKVRIFGKLIEVYRLTDGNDELIGELEAAKSETQFTKSLDHIKKGLPDALLIHRRNPLAVLYKSLSIGIHLLDDEDCLKQAQAIRMVLVKMAEDIDHLLKDDAELKNSIDMLTN